MDFEMFLNMYCSQRVKARASILNKKKYIDNQFLHEVGFMKFTTSINGNVVKLETLLKPHEIIVNNIEFIQDNYSLPSSFDIYEICKGLKLMFIDYIAEEPSVCIQASLQTNMFNIPVYNGNKIIMYDDTEIIL